MLSEQRGLECADCGGVTPQSNPSEFDECPKCTSDNTTVVVISDCPIGEDCTDDDHHFGLGKHVSEVW